MISAAALRRCIVYHLEDMKYTDVKSLGAGAFGDVLSAVSPQKEKVAIKIIQSAYSWPLEEEIWPRLNHPNILPVMDIIDMKNYRCKLYVTPLHLTNLDSIVQTEEFRKHPDSLVRIKNWLKDILSALHYLHSAGFCHMDLKRDNVLISVEDSAVLCDFSGINVAHRSLQRFVSPFAYRPPECYDPEALPNVRGVPYDMWTFGFMALNMLTNGWPDERVANIQNHNQWKEKVVPMLTKALREKHFKKLMKKALPAVKLSTEDQRNALDFLSSLLKFQSSDRPSAAQIMCHPFLTSDVSEKVLAAGQRLTGVAVCDANESNLRHDNLAVPQSRLNPFLNISGDTRTEIRLSPHVRQTERSSPVHSIAPSLDSYRDTSTRSPSELHIATQPVHDSDNRVELTAPINDSITTTPARGLTKNLRVWIRKKVVNVFKKKKYNLLTNEE